MISIQYASIFIKILLLFKFQNTRLKTLNDIGYNNEKIFLVIQIYVISIHKKILSTTEDIWSNSYVSITFLTN